MLRVTFRILAVAIAVLCTALATTQPQTANAAGSGYLAPMSPGFLRDVYSLPSDQTYAAFVHFGAGTAADRRNLLGAYGLNVGRDFEPHARAVFAFGTVGAFRNLAGDLNVTYLEDNQKLQYDMNTAPWATRVRVAQEPVSGGPYKDAAGNVLRGQGTTIVVVDSGLNGAHPDFAGRIKHNYKVVCQPLLVETATGLCFGGQVIDVGESDSDTTGGHGTHCVGIAAGGGQASTGDYPVAGAAPSVKGTHTGVAPDASIIAYGAGEGIHMLWIAEAYTHMLNNWDPTIKVVSNSFGSTGAYNPSSIESILMNAVVAQGASVIRSAGNGDTVNNGGTGADDRTRQQCKSPTPGVICVANMDDLGTGSRDGTLDFSSSRGLKGSPATYPDIAAPGSGITATCMQPLPGQAVCATGAETTWQPYYGTISGTSMATPHVAGAIALLAQADPTLAPAQMEALIQKTAYKVSSNGPYEADPQNPEATTNFGVGAGMIDVQAALDALGTAHGGTPASGTEVVILDGYTAATAAGAANIQKLTMQETTVGTNTTGIRYRLTLKNATNFAEAPNGLVYQLDQNVNGAHFRTSISATPAGVANKQSGSGNATSVTRAGNVVTFFVPYVQLGLAPVGSSIHNVTVSVYEAASGLLLNTVPHVANSTPASQVAHPMYGKPFSVQLAASGGGGGGESSCTVPGLTVVTDGMGDSLLPTPGTDLLGLSVALPHATSLAAAKLVFTLRTDPGRALQPVGSGWYASFSNPRDQKVYGVRMVFKATSPTFESYLASGSLNTSDPEAEGQTDGRFADVTKLADPNSNYDHKSGRITIVVPMSDLNVQPGDVIGGFNGGSTFTTNPQELPGAAATQVWDPMPDSLGYVGSFATYNPTDSSVCPVSASPPARLSPTSLAFGPQALTTKSAAKTVVYTNTGTMALPINSVATASQGSVAEFVQTNNCPSKLAVGASCTISVQFRPVQTGARTGTLTIIANNGRRTDTVALSGTGQ
jgi:subtilisin family serine protease